MKYYFNFQLSYTSGMRNIQQIEPLRHHAELKLRNKNPISVGLSSLNFGARILKQPCTGLHLTLATLSRAGPVPPCTQL